jgi:hypothetical protein
MDPVVRNGLIWLCGAAAAAVLCVATMGAQIADGFKVVAVLLALVGLAHVVWGLARD